MSAERVELNDIKFNADTVYKPSDFRARLGMLGDLFKDKPGFQEHMEELIVWVEPYDDKNTIIRWEEDQDGLLHPIARTSYPLL